MVTIELCKQCDKPALVQFAWPTSTGPQEALLCEQHAADWWKTYQHTPAGLGLVITRL